MRSIPSARARYSLVLVGRKAITGWEMSTKVERAGVEISDLVPFVLSRILIALSLHPFSSFFFPCVVREWHGQSFVSSRTTRNMIIQLALQKIFLNTTKQKKNEIADTEIFNLHFNLYLENRVLIFWHFLIENKSTSDSLKMILMFDRLNYILFLWF